MANGIAKGVGEQLGQLGKQIVTEVAQVPAKITGMDSGGTNEGLGQMAASAKQAQAAKKQQAQVEQKKIQDITRRDEVEKQRKLAEARQLLKQFSALPQEQSIAEKQELEELEKKKQEVIIERERAKKILRPASSKPKRGNLFGIKSKQFAGEVGKNVKSQ